MGIFTTMFGCQDRLIRTALSSLGKQARIRRGAIDQTPARRNANLVNDSGIQKDLLVPPLMDSRLSTPL